MKVINFNGSDMKISAGAERILETLASRKFIAGKDAFVEGKGKNQRSLLQHENLSAIGVREVPREHPKTNIERQFFERNTRRHFVISGDKRRINAILKKLINA